MASLVSRGFTSGCAMIFRVLAGARPPRPKETKTRILCLTSAGVGDMLDTLPLFHALKRHHPQAHLTVACDPPGAPIAQACAAVDEIIVLEPTWNSWRAALKNAARLRNHDWVIAVKVGFDRRLALLTRITHAALRVGFERRVDPLSAYYTDPVALSDVPNDEHQAATLLRLLKPLGIIKTTNFSIDSSLNLPDSAREFAAEIMAETPFLSSRRFMLVNFSSTFRLKFHEEDFIALLRRILGTTNILVVLVPAPSNQSEAEEIAACMASDRIFTMNRPGPLDLAALMGQASISLTFEDETAQLAAAVDAPALVLCLDEPRKKGYPRGKRLVFVHAKPGEQVIPDERIWLALQPFVASGQDGIEKKGPAF
ncbi:MAG: hypothetical protein LV480_08155 [Methylacidiphilales bacterium]|nr:hypothetical protein [Candidatus Methylacidiphilales bacterium]